MAFLMTLWALVLFAVYLWSLRVQRVANEKFTSSHPFNLPLRNLLPTPTKTLHLTNIRKQKAADFNSAMYTDEACGRYRKRNVINTQKKKYVSGRRISISTFELCRSQWPRALRRRSSASRLLRLWVRIPPGAWMFVCCECCVLSGRRLCDGLITRPEESYRLWRVGVCN
jgi:hypothetical protein